MPDTPQAALTTVVGDETYPIICNFQLSTAIRGWFDLTDINYPPMLLFQIYELLFDCLYFGF
jgi:hypothetical protein